MRRRQLLDGVTAVVQAARLSIYERYGRLVSRRVGVAGVVDRQTVLGEAGHVDGCSSHNRLLDGQFDSSTVESKRRVHVSLFRTGHFTALLSYLLACLPVVARLLAARNVQLQLRFRGEHCLRVARAKVSCNSTLAAYRGHFGARTVRGPQGGRGG